MRYIRLFEEYIHDIPVKEKEPVSKTDVKSNTDILYKDKNMVVMVVKSAKSADTYGRNTTWCSVGNEESFNDHYATANLYRILYKDGYKLRLTWDYCDDGGTHWGQGGKVNGKEKSYTNIRPRDNDDPFIIDYNKKDYRQELVDKIKSLPKNIVDIIKKYQNEHSIDKTEEINLLSQEIQKIKIKNVLYKPGSMVGDLILDIIYEGKEYTIELRVYYSGNDIYMNRYEVMNKEFISKFKYRSKLTVKTSPINAYLKDKVYEFLKKNDNKTLLEIKSKMKKDI